MGNRKEGDGEVSEGASEQVDRFRAVRPEQDYHPSENPTVDEVVQSLGQLEKTPVSEHVRIFEEATDRLRDALADAGDGNPDS